MAKKKIAAGTLVGLGALGFGLWYLYRGQVTVTTIPGQPGPGPDPSDGPGGLGPITAQPGGLSGPITAQPAGPSGPIVAQVQIFDPGVFSGSDFDCARAGQGFNVAQWSTDPAIGPDRVAAALTLLGFTITAKQINAGDKVRVENRRIWNVPFVNPQRSDTVRNFQAYARSLGLPGLGNAPASAVDGIMGECSLVALSAAAEIYNAGQWVKL